MDIISDSGLTILVLAAGKGARMKSSLPKVLHRIGHKPLLKHVLDTVEKLSPTQIVVVHGNDASPIKAVFGDKDITWVLQSQPQGTGHAVLQAVPFIPLTHRVLILYGDVPLISPDTLSQLLQTPPGEIGLLTAVVENPFGLGRIFRENGIVKRIIEEQDATSLERSIGEINTGILLIEMEHLAKGVLTLNKNNAQGEYYITDLIAWAVTENIPINTIAPKAIHEIMGVNDREQQVTLERIYQREQAHHFLQKGVMICDPSRFDLRGTLEAEDAVTIDINVVLEGHNTLRRGCRIGPHCVLINCDIGEEVDILAYSYLEGVKVASNARIGPFARLRPGTVLAKEVHIGNFVEIKNANIGEGSKISHLSYIGDTLMGKGVNVGAGTITCNYDGKQKHQTIIEDDVYIGSDSQLIAPVRVGKGATLGAGTILHKDAPSYQLTLTQRLEHRSKIWERPTKDKKE